MAEYIQDQNINKIMFKNGVSKFNLVTHDGNTKWELSGELVYDSVPANIVGLERARPIKKNSNNMQVSGEGDGGGDGDGAGDKVFWDISFAKLEKLDSCGAAFLIDCMRYARQSGFELRFINFPKSVYPLLQVQGVSELFEPLVCLWS